MRAPTVPFRATIHLREIYCVHKSPLTQRDTRSWHVAAAGNRLRSRSVFWPRIPRFIQSKITVNIFGWLLFRSV